jgi:hypothetical protein
MLDPILWYLYLQDKSNNPFPDQNIQQRKTYNFDVKNLTFTATITVWHF